MIAATAVWFWPLFLALVLFGIVRVALAARRGQAFRDTSPVIDAHPRLFLAAVIAVIVVAAVWLAVQSL